MKNSLNKPENVCHSKFQSASECLWNSYSRQLANILLETLCSPNTMAGRSASAWIICAHPKFRIHNVPCQATWERWFFHPSSGDLFLRTSASSPERVSTPALIIWQERRVREVPSALEYLKNRNRDCPVFWTQHQWHKTVLG